MDLVSFVEEPHMQSRPTAFQAGDTVRVNVKIKEGDKFRIQPFEGVVIALNRHQLSSTFVVRKISNGIGVERIFPLYSPMIEGIVRLKRGRVRRAKLFYLRERKGKAARIREIRETRATAS